MKHIHNRLATLVRAMLIGLLGSSPVLADDTEIYLGSGAGVTAIRPNLLFVVDTSGSMTETASVLPVDKPAYDPATTYSGSYVADRIYYGNNTNSYIDAAYLHCTAAVSALANSGYYTDRFVQWKRSNSCSSSGTHNWRALACNSKKVECYADMLASPRDGAVDNDDLHATNTNTTSGGGWSSSSSNAVNWAGLTASTLKTGNYKNWEAMPSTITKSRMTSVKEALHSLADSLSGVNIGLMRYDRNAEGGMVLQAMDNVETNRTEFLSLVDTLAASGSTPLAETMYEAAMYYKGEQVDFGSTSTECVSTDFNDSCDVVQSKLSVAASRAGGVITAANYNSPIDEQCQQNYIVYLTDGDPTSDTSFNSTRYTRADLGSSYSCSTVGGSSDTILSGAGVSTLSYASNCMDDIALELASNDQSTAYLGDQKVSTFTIGFGDGISAGGKALLEHVARVSKTASGIGEYAAAESAQDLVDVFTNIVIQITGSNNTFSSPAVSVNAFNRTTHRDELYFSLFKPSYGSHWDGNFKRYRLDIDSNGDPNIVDRFDHSAVNPDTGYFFKDADTSVSVTSYWSETADYDDVTIGGAAGDLDVTRAIYTYTDDATLDLVDVHESNDTLDPYLGAISVTADELLQWARGVSADGSAVKRMGDPLHGEPALIQYGGTEAVPDITAFVPTNDGYLHAFNVTDENTAEEVFAFIPKELLGNLGSIYEDNSNDKKIYGLDGSVTAWVKDQDQDGNLSDAGDHAYIYFGMRRGGKNYYAMDVSNRSAPKLMWIIKGGTGDFAELSQTWSQPQLRKLSINGADKYVLIFGGGYDTDQDGASVRTTDDTGRAIYIVDAETGARLWWASNQASADLQLGEMDYSIPSAVAVSDADGDGYADLIHVGDMGGQIWRFDIKKGATGQQLSSLITGGRIANLGGSTATHARRFYYPPSVAIAKQAGERFLALAIASGFRAHPLDTNIEDRIYMLKDGPVKGAPENTNGDIEYVTLTENDLYDTTSNDVRSSDSNVRATATSALQDAAGWYIRLETSGEKGLAKGVIFQDLILITTYLPKDNTNTANACLPNEGTGNLYILSLADGGAYNSDDVLDRTSTALMKAGIPADPKLIFTDDPDQKDFAVCVGTECIKSPTTTTHKKLYWFGR